MANNGNRSITGDCLATMFVALMLIFFVSWVVTKCTSG
jgi:flagellar biogenesis protein FliO